MYKKITSIAYQKSIYYSFNDDQVFEKQRFEAFRIFSFVGFLVCVGIVTKMLLTLKSGSSLPYLILILGFVLLLNFYSVRNTNQLRDAYIIMLGATFLLLHTVAYKCGGIQTAGTFFFSSVVLFSFILIGRIGGIVFTCLVILHLIYMYVLTTFTDYTSFELFQSNEVLISQDFLTNSILNLGLIASLSAYLQSDRNAIIESLMKSKQQLGSLNDKLLESNHVLVKKNAELDKYTSITAHDLKAPLRAIASLSDMLEEDIHHLIDEDARYKLAKIKGRVERMDKLVNAIIEYAQADKMVNQPSQIQFNSWLKNLIQNNFAEHEHVDFEISSNDLEMYVDSRKWSIILQNLIENAIAFNHQERTKISISMQETEDEYQFSISDNGPGIAEEFKDKVFVLFQTLKPRDEKECIGAGLAIVKKIIDQEKGKIWIDYRNPKTGGTTIQIKWPKIKQIKINLKPISKAA